MCYLGANQTDIAAMLGVSVTTLKQWRETYPEFDYAWRDGGMHADSKVAAALYKRALGYEYVKWKDTKEGRMEELVHMPADVGACQYWLNNRRADLWQTKVEHELPNGASIGGDGLSDLEAARRIAFALAKAVYANEQRSIEHDSHAAPAPETK